MTGLPELLRDPFAVDLPEGWKQGRTAYGGVSAAIALAAAKAAHPDLPPLASMQIAFVGPLAGPLGATPTLLRRGKNSAFIACDVSGEDGLGLRALFLFMAARGSHVSHLNLPLPEPLPDRLDPASITSSAPTFLQNFELTQGLAAGGTIRRWVRLKQRDGLDREVELAAVADALPPAAMSLISQFGPISSTTWQLNVVTERVRTDHGWWLLEAKTLNAANGTSSQSMTIWNRMGDPVAVATQSVALFV